MTKGVDGKTLTRTIPAGPAVARTQAQIEEYRRLRRLTQELVEVSEGLCEAALERPIAAPDAAKKTLQSELHEALETEVAALIGRRCADTIELDAASFHARIKKSTRQLRTLAHETLLRARQDYPHIEAATLLALIGDPPIECEAMLFARVA